MSRSSGITGLGAGAGSVCSCFGSEESGDKLQHVVFEDLAEITGRAEANGGETSKFNAPWTITEPTFVDSCPRWESTALTAQQKIAANNMRINVRASFWSSFIGAP